MTSLAGCRPASSPSWRRWCWQQERVRGCAALAPSLFTGSVGRPMVMWVLGALSGLELSRVVVVVGHGSTRMTKALAEAGSPTAPLEVVEQPVQRGTGDALSVALTAFSEDDGELDDLVVLPGDTPLLRPGTLAASLAAHRGMRRRRPRCSRPGSRTRAGTAEWCAPGTAGSRASSRKPTPPRTSAPSTRWALPSMSFAGPLLAPALRRLSPDNAQGEYYLTDVIAVLHDAGYPVISMVVPRPHRGQRGQRPSPAGGGRGRAAGTDQRAVDAPGGHHARPPAHLPRLDGRARQKTSPFSQGLSFREHESRHRRRDRARALIWSTAPWERGHRCGRPRRNRW